MFQRLRKKYFIYLLLPPFLIWLSLSTSSAYAIETAIELRQIFAKTIDRTLTLPDEEQHYYAELLIYKLHQADLHNLPAQYILLIDRNPRVQAGLLFWLSEEDIPEFIGASPVSTGKENGYDFFETPLGIFEHLSKNLDFRAEGTKNKRGLMGYGEKGMRVYDFGWVTARKTWLPEMGNMRLQLHSTDLLHLEPKLGSTQSKGCIRIPATLNKLLDHYGILDADYEQNKFKINVRNALDADREINLWAGKYLIVVDSRRLNRPDWSPKPETSQHPIKKRKASSR